MVGNHLPQEWKLESKKEPEKEQNGKPALKTFASTDLSIISNDTHTPALNEPIWHKETSQLLGEYVFYMSCLMTKPTVWLCAQRRLRSAMPRLIWVFAGRSTPRLIWVFAGRTLTLLVLSRGGSYSCDENINLEEKFCCPNTLSLVSFAGMTLISVPSFGSGH